MTEEITGLQAGVNQPGTTVFAVEQLAPPQEEQLESVPTGGPPRLPTTAEEIKAYEGVRNNLAKEHKYMVRLAKYLVNSNFDHNTLAEYEPNYDGEDIANAAAERILKYWYTAVSPKTTFHALAGRVVRNVCIDMFHRAVKHRDHGHEVGPEYDELCHN